MHKLLLVTEDYWPRRGGVANYYGGLVKAMDGAVAVLTCVPGENDVNTQRVKYYWRFGRPKWLPLLWIIPRFIKLTKSDVVWVGDIWPVGIATWLITRIYKIPYIVSLHGFDYNLTQTTFIKRWLSKKILLGASLITVNSEFTGKLIKRSINMESKQIILYPTANQLPSVSKDVVENIKSRHQLNGKKIILTVARLVARKGVDTVLRALAILTKKHNDIYYVIVGDGPERQRLEQLKKILKVDGIFTGEISSEELSAWYSICDVFVLTPKNDPVDVEGYGIVYLEAAQFGKPTVASNVGGVSEAAGTRAFYGNNTVEIAAAIAKALQQQSADNKSDNINPALRRTIKTEAEKFRQAIDKL